MDAAEAKAALAWRLRVESFAKRVNASLELHEGLSASSSREYVSRAAAADLAVLRMLTDAVQSEADEYLGLPLATETEALVVATTDQAIGSAFAEALVSAVLHPTAEVGTAAAALVSSLIRVAGTVPTLDSLVRRVMDAGFAAEATQQACKLVGALAMAPNAPDVAQFVVAALRSACDAYSLVPSSADDIRTFISVACVAFCRLVEVSMIPETPDAPQRLGEDAADLVEEMSDIVVVSLVEFPRVAQLAADSVSEAVKCARDLFQHQQSASTIADAAVLLIQAVAVAASAWETASNASCADQLRGLMSDALVKAKLPSLGQKQLAWSVIAAGCELQSLVSWCIDQGVLGLLAPVVTQLARADSAHKALRLPLAKVVAALLDARNSTMGPQRRDRVQNKLPWPLVSQFASKSLEVSTDDELREAVSTMLAHQSDD